MRASAAHSIEFDGVLIPTRRCVAVSQTRDAISYMERNLTAGLFHASASLGIAETAHQTATRSGSRRAARAGHADADPRRRSGDRSLGLPCRTGPHRRPGHAHRLEQPTHVGTNEEITALFTEAQSTKTFVNEAAPRSSTARWPCRAARATSAAIPSTVPTGTSAPARLHASPRREPRLRPRRQHRSRARAGKTIEHACHSRAPVLSPNSWWCST